MTEEATILVTLAEVRAHVVQRYEYCRKEEARTDADATHCYAHRYAACELTEVLALLDRVKEGGAG